MKHIYYLLAFVTVMFASCDPLSGVYKDIDAHPVKQTITFTSTTAYASTAVANTGIAALLNTKYGNSPDRSTAVVTVPFATSVPLVPDSLYAHVAYTLVTADYTIPAGTNAAGITITANTFADLNAAGVINYLNYKFPTPAANQLEVLTYIYFETGVTGTPTVTDSFLFLNGQWTKIYTISPAQYTLVNRGLNNFFTANDLAVLPSYFNAFLKADPTVMVTAKAGDVKYISYKYTATYQKVLPMLFDGTNWVDKLALNFLKLNGTWVPDPTIYYTIPASANNADYAYLKTTTIGSDAARANVASFGDFDIRTNGATTAWSDADVTAGLAAILLHHFPTPTAGIPYTVNYSVYTGSVSQTSKTYIYNGTAFIFQP